MPPITVNEVGKTYNKTNFKLLRDAYKALKAAIANFGDPESDDDTEDPPVEKKDTKEASGNFSQNDLAMALQGELAEINPNARICDIFTDTNTLCYQVGWSMSSPCYQVTYTIDDTGVATFSDPVECTRKVTYIVKSDTGAGTEQIADQGMAMAGMESDREIIGDPVNLIERALKPDGSVMLKLIAPGWGSSGYYPSEVLKRDGPKVFKRGMHNFIDHPTPSEEASRPEGSLEKLGSTLLEDAKWYDDYAGNGAGLYAPAKPVPTFAETLDQIAPYIGTSIRAGGIAKMGIAEGRSGPIIEALTIGKSVDYVTKAGAGGKVLTLMESARNNQPIDTEGDHTMAINETQFKRLQEANEQLRDRLNRQEANQFIERQIAKLGATLPTSTRLRVIDQLATVAIPVTENGAIDATALTTLVENAVTTEAQYLAKLGVGSVRGLGNASPANLAEVDIDKEWAKLDQL